MVKLEPLAPFRMRLDLGAGEPNRLSALPGEKRQLIVAMRRACSRSVAISNRDIACTGFEGTRPRRHMNPRIRRDSGGLLLSSNPRRGRRRAEPAPHSPGDRASHASVCKRLPTVRRARCTSSQSSEQPHRVRRSPLLYQQFRKVSRAVAARSTAPPTGSSLPSSARIRATTR